MIPQASELLPFLPLGLLAGVLSGLLGVGGGLVFSPLLLLLGLEPHQALATSTLAIVPTTLGGTWTHLRSRTLPLRSGAAIALGASLGAAFCSRLGMGLQGSLLLALQATLYVGLALLIRPRAVQAAAAAPRQATLAALGSVGAVAGLASGLLGVGGGLLMVPLLGQGLGVPLHLAIRYSTLAVLASAATASATFVADGRGLWTIGLALGGPAALAAQWSAARMERLPEHLLVVLLRGLTLLLAADSSRRALALWG
ncbi:MULTISPECIES: sulfite exporter TauE/SafE family protein [unclassified Cyanobium]|uniref:sulfite exporter TauE/SafE family protein n=1 Tax=unclassified Cyanobium TaxID=2627006 RepID=UPI0018606FD3|nr:MULTISPECIES: sulfite exporter TauE/SafE family protein [unclassified Cyanobium]QNI70810.1 putative conserved membrane protein [Cyanobium sp. NS01]